MTTHPNVLNALEALAIEMQVMHMAHTAQRSAFVALALHLARQGHVQLPVLAADLETLGSTQPERDWQSGHAELAALLRLCHAQP